MNSHENTALNDVRWPADPKWQTTRAVGQLSYLEGGFGADAANDGIYTPAEIEHAAKVLRRYVAIFGLLR